MTILALIKELLSELVGLVRGINSSRDKSNFRGDIMYIVKADHPEIGFNLSFTVTDSEGNESDNEDAVDITVDETGRAGTVMFGNPGLANVNATVESEEGVLLGSFGAQFTVTVGDPAAIVGGALVFEGLTETIEPAPPVEPEPVVVPEVPVV